MNSKHMRSILAIAIALAPVSLVLAQDTTSVPLDNYLDTIDGLQSPTDATWLAGGGLAILEADTGRIQVTGPAGSRRVLETDCLFAGGLDAGADGSLVIADTGKHRLVRFGPDGSLLEPIGSHGDGPAQFRSPGDVALHGDRIIVADTGNDRIVVLAGDGSPVRTIGSRGNQPGQFRRPRSVAIDDAGRIIVADMDNHRIQVLSSEGEPIAHWGSWGSHPGLLQEPSDVECVGEHIFVTDRLNHRVQVFNSDGSLLHVWGMHAVRPREGEGRIHYPDALAVTPDGQQLAVVESFEDRVQFFGPHDPDVIDDRPVQPARKGIQSHFGPNVTLDGRILVVWEPEARVALVFDHERRAPIRLTSIFSTGEKANRPGGFGHLADLHWDHEANHLDLFDSGTGQVHTYSLELPDPDRPRFDPNMARLLSTRSLDPSIATHRVVDAVRARDGHWHLLDETDGIVLVLDEKMRPVRRWGEAELQRPVAILQDPATDELLVLDRGHGAVLRFDQAGRPAGRMMLDTLPGGISNPTGIAATGNGELFITDAGRHVVHRLAPDGSHVSTWGRKGSDHEEFWKPAGIVIDDRDRVFVLDHGNHRCQVFDTEGTWLMTFGAGRAYTPQNTPRPGGNEPGSKKDGN